MREVRRNGDSISVSMRGLTAVLAFWALVGIIIAALIYLPAAAWVWIGVAVIRLSLVLAACLLSWSVYSIFQE